MVEDELEDVEEVSEEEPAELEPKAEPPSRPDWLPTKFKNEREFTEAYANLEREHTGKSMRLSQLEQENQYYRQAYTPAAEAAVEDEDYEFTVTELKLKKAVEEQKQRSDLLMQTVQQMNYNYAMSEFERTIEKLEGQEGIKLDEAARTAIMEEAKNINLPSVRQQVEKAFKIVAFDKKPSMQVNEQVKTDRKRNITGLGVEPPDYPLDSGSNKEEPDVRSKEILKELGLGPKARKRVVERYMAEDEEEE